MLWLGTLTSVILVLLAFKFFTFIKGADIAFWGVIALLCQPFGIYFHLGMSEGLFLCALLGSFFSIATRSSIGLAVSATALVLVRPNGLFLLPVLMIYAAEADQLGWRAVIRRPASWIGRIWPLAFPVLAFFGYSVFQWTRTGNPFAFSAAQAGWGRSFTWPFAGFFNGGDFATQFDSWYTVVLLLLAIAIWRKLPLSFNMLIWISILLPLFSGSVASMPRFTTVMFPLFLFAGEVLAKHRWRIPIVMSSFVLQLFWLGFWLRGDWLAC